ncbi:MAG: DMT family transporter [Armatimonadota bacterium]|nr:DMT family transporter [Armatimonadota bacterium]
MIGEAAGLGAALAFGLSTVLARRFMVAVPPEAGALVSIVMNVVVFTALAAAVAWRGALPPVHPGSVALFVAGGLAGTLVGRNLSYMSVARLGPSLSSTVRLTNSVFTLAFGLLILGELPRPWQIAGILVVTAGLWLTLWPAQPAARRGSAAVRFAARGGPRGLAPMHTTTPDGSAISLQGLALAVVSAAAFALGDTMRRLALVLTPAPVLGAAIGASSALVAHLLWAVRRHSARWPAASLGRVDLLGSAAANTAALLLLYVGLSRAPAATVAALYNLQVLVVIVASPLVLPGQERITPGLVAGTLLALVGTVMILWG